MVPTARHVPVAPLGQADRGAAGEWAEVSGGSGNPVVDGPDPVGVDRELLHHLVGDELRGRVDPGPLGHGPADEVGEAQRRGVAQLGKEHDGEVVDGDHPGRPGRRGDHEVGAVHHVAPADEPLDGRQGGP